MKADCSNQIVRIGCASAFWGDTSQAAQQLLNNTELDYLVFDYLAEVTLSIMAGQRLKDPNAGYAKDFVSAQLGPVLPLIEKQNVKVISNAGGLNPVACQQALERLIEAQDLNLRVVTVSGDDLHHLTPQLQSCRELDSFEPLPETLLNINAYLGAPGISAALASGADIVITGRIVDSALVTGPLMHEFGWSWQDYDRLAQSALAGHIIECGTQCTGGNFTDWESIPDVEQIGFPVVECHSDGSFIITKPENTGGRVSIETVAEQVVYEVSDPTAYRLPDVTCDFSHISLAQEGPDRVRVTGAKGAPPSNQYKVSATYQDGFRCTALCTLVGIDAVRKARHIGQALIKRSEILFQQLALPAFKSTQLEILGSEVNLGRHGLRQDSREVVLRVAVAHPDQQALTLFAKEIAQAATALAPGLTGLLGGRPSVSPIIRLYSTLVDKELVKVQIHTKEGSQDISIPAPTAATTKSPAPAPAPSEPPPETQLSEVPLITLALGRSGDKGDHANIGVIARAPEYLPWIRQALTEQAVHDYLSHLLDHPDSKVIRYEWPGLNGLNFELRHALGGGGMASLRSDPQGKAFAQQLLDIPVSIPTTLLQPADNQTDSRSQSAAPLLPQTRQTPLYRSVFQPGLFAGQQIIVTGGGSGIGRCTAHELASLGAHVILVGRKREKLVDVAAEIRADGGQADLQVCDIREEEQVKQVVSEIVQGLGPIHGLVNNAGGQFPAPLAQINQKGFETVVRTNLVGGFLFARELFKQSMELNGGSIVNITANNWGGMPGMGHSGAARAGMDNLTKTAAIEWASHGVRVNAVSPGYVASSGLDSYEGPFAQIIPTLCQQVPLGRFASESEVSAMICFLLSKAAAYITGTTVTVDGGAPLAHGLWPKQPIKNSYTFCGFHRAVKPRVLNKDA